MAKAATSKQTGQGGTSHEDKVIAYFLVCMMGEILPFGSRFGLIKEVSFQAGADGWLFDDALLRLSDGIQTLSIAVSAKSNRQFNSNGCPKKINRLLWEQYLNVNSPVFNKDSDHLCLIQEQLSAAVSSDLTELLKLAAAQDSKTFHQRVFAQLSKGRQKIYKSFYCPADLAGTYTIKEEDTGDMLKSFFYYEMDLDKHVSKDESRTIELCRNCLENKDQSAAENLYNDLRLLPRNISPVGGSLDRKALILHLKDQYILSNAPSYTSDWKKINKFISEKFSIIPGKLGHGLVIDRKDLIAHIDKIIADATGLVLQGISGCGKTNIAKLFAEQKGKENSIIWLDSTDFESTSVEADMRLDHSLSEIIEETSGGQAYLIVDGIDRLYHERQQKKVAIILKKALAETSSWKVVLTCPTDQIDKIRQTFSNFDLSYVGFENFEIPQLTVEELQSNASVYPLLEKILFSDSMNNISGNLKLLDKLIQNSKNLSSLSADGNLGESHLIDFVWQEEIEKNNNGLQAASFLKLLSEKQADRLSIGINTSLFTPEELRAADDLRSLTFLRINQGKLYFIHDLYSDCVSVPIIRQYQIRD